MKIIFIRHAEPDYEKDSLTEKGFREAQILSKRIADWNVTEFYCSPLGRAQATAQPTLDRLGRRAVICDWLQEFTVPAKESGEHVLLWDLLPEELQANKGLFEPEAWMDTPFMKQTEVRQYYEHVTGEFDRLLESYGYKKNGLYYNSPKQYPASNHYMKYDGHTIEHMKDCRTDDTTIVCFCHLGVMLMLISYLIHTTPSMLWQGVFVPPSSVTVIASEEREPGKAYFRCQQIGDASHLREAGEPISYYGSFNPPFQG